MHQAPVQDTPAGDAATGAHLSALDDMEALFGRPEPGRTATPNAVAVFRPRRRPGAAIIAGLVALIAIALVFVVRTPGQSAATSAPVTASRTIAARPAEPPLAVSDPNGVEELDSTPLTFAPPIPTAPVEAPRRPIVERDVVAEAAPPPARAPTPVSEYRVAPTPTPNLAPVIQTRALSRPADPCTTPADRGSPECLADALRSADFALRRAYYAAEQADIAPAALRHYRREWDRVRRFGADDPQGTIENYRGMTRDLNALADRGEGDIPDGDR